MAVSLLAAFALVGSYFAGLRLLATRDLPTLIRIGVAGAFAALNWSVVLAAARISDAVVTEEATFHHLYVLGVVGLPAAGCWSILSHRGERRVGRPPTWLSVVLLLPGLFGVWATHIEPGWLRTERILLTPLGVIEPQEATNSGFQSAPRPVRIGVIADIQTDKFGDFEAEVISHMNELEPDVVLVAGDILQTWPSDFRAVRDAAISEFSKLQAPYGVFVVAGNNDTDPEFSSFVEASGHRYLEDELFEIEVNSTVLRIAGVGWPNNGRRAAIETVDELIEGASSSTLDIVLAHSPDVVLDIAEPEAVDLIVSGHTHGGQIQLPGIGPLWNVTELPRSIAAGGLHTYRGTQIYVSSGIGVDRLEAPKIRFGARPSIGLLTLQPASRSPD